MDSQATVSISSEEVQSLRLANAKLEAEAAVGPKKSKGNKKLASSAVLEEYAKDLRVFTNKFTLMDFPWVELKAFLQPPPLVPTLPADQRYEDDATTLLHMRHRLYESCPPHLHIYIEKLGDFGTNVCAILSKFEPCSLSIQSSCYTNQSNVQIPYQGFTDMVTTFFPPSFLRSLVICAVVRLTICGLQATSASAYICIKTRMAISLSKRFWCPLYMESVSSMLNASFRMRFFSKYVYLTNSSVFVSRPSD